MKNKILITSAVVIVVILIMVIMFKQPSDNMQKENVVLTGETKEFEIVVKNWEFIPNVIEVNKGDKVELHLETVQGWEVNS